MSIGEYKTPKLPAVLFAEHSSQGSRGVVSAEDQKNFQISTHEITQSPLVLEKGVYPLTLAFPLAASYTIKLEEEYKRIPLKNAKIQGKIKMPNGEEQKIELLELNEKKVIDEGVFESGQAIAWMSLKSPLNKGGLGNLKLAEDGKYTISLNGEATDEFGNIYEIGGEYEVYVGKTLTFVSAVKPGTSFFVGDVYIPRFGYNPPIPGKATFIYDFYPFDPSKQPQHIEITKENLHGGFSSDLIPFEEPGEYTVQIMAEGIGHQGEKYFGFNYGGSLIVPRESEVELHGKIGGNFFDTVEKVETPRFELPRNSGVETHREFYWPYYSGDILKIAAHEKNSINPAVELVSPLDKGGLGDLKQIPIFPIAENNLHPFNYPEKITHPSYVFLTSQKAGFIGRHLVTTDYIDHAFWNARGHDFGGRLNATKNGDLENDGYHNFATAYKKEGENHLSATYISSLTFGAEDAASDKVFAPFEEPITFHNGRDQLFVIGTSHRKTLGGKLSQYFHVSPAIKGVQIDITTTKPDGTKHKFPRIETDEGGFTPIGEMIDFDQEGVWDMLVEAEYNGKKETDFYHNFVISKETKELDVKIPPFSIIDPKENLVFNMYLPEKSENIEFEYQVLIPGAILDTKKAGIGEWEKEGNIITYTFDPIKFNSLYKNFEIDPHWSRITIFYFHVSGDIKGEKFNAFRSVMVRNNQMIVME